MRMGCPLIPPSLTGPLAGGVGAEEVEVTGVVVTPMKHAPLEGGKRKGWIFQQDPNPQIWGQEGSSP